MRLSFIHSSADLGNRLDQTGKVRCSTGSLRSVPQKLQVQAGWGTVGLTLDVAFPPASLHGGIDEQVMYAYCGRWYRGERPVTTTDRHHGEESAIRGVTGEC